MTNRLFLSWPCTRYSIAIFSYHGTGNHLSTTASGVGNHECTMQLSNFKCQTDCLLELKIQSHITLQLWNHSISSLCLLILKHVGALNLYKLGPINGPFPIGKTLQNSQFSTLEIPKFYKLYIMCIKKIKLCWFSFNGSQLGDRLKNKT